MSHKYTQLFVSVATLQVGLLLYSFANSFTVFFICQLNTNLHIKRLKGALFPSLHTFPDHVIDFCYQI